MDIALEPMSVQDSVCHYNYGENDQRSVAVDKLCQSKQISNDQELIHSDLTSCPQNSKGNN